MFGQVFHVELLFLFLLKLEITNSLSDLIDATIHSILQRYFTDLNTTFEYKHHVIQHIVIIFKN